MSDITTLEMQKKTKPKIEEVIPYYLEEDMKQTALNFIAWLRNNKMRPVWAIHNGWKVIKGKQICYIRLGKEWVNNTKDARWEVTIFLHHLDEYENEIVNEGLQNLLWDKVWYCNICFHACNPAGMGKVIIGKEFANLCKGMYGNSFPVSFANPDETVLKSISRLLELEQQARNSK